MEGKSNEVMELELDCLVSSATAAEVGCGSRKADVAVFTDFDS